MTLVSPFSVTHVHSSWHCCCYAGAIEGIAISPTASTTFFSIVASLIVKTRHYNEASSFYAHKLGCERPLLALSGHAELHCTCPLSGVKRT